MFLTKSSFIKAHKKIFYKFYLDRDTEKSKLLKQLLDNNNIEYNLLGFVLDDITYIDKDSPVIVTEYKNLDYILKKRYDNIYYLRDTFEVRKVNNYEKKFKNGYNLDAIRDYEFVSNIVLFSAVSILKQIKSYIELKGGIFCNYSQLLINLDE